MEPRLEKYQGIHPGLIIGRELKKRGIKKGPFAISLEMYPQTLNEITKGRRLLNPETSLKMDRALGWQEGSLLLLQAWYEIHTAQIKLNAPQHPDLNIIGRSLFWDADYDQIDWVKKYKAVIRRIFERGDEVQKQEALRFYGKEKIREVTGKSGIKNNQLPVLGHADRHEG